MKKILFLQLAFLIFAVAIWSAPLTVYVTDGTIITLNDTQKLDEFITSNKPASTAALIVGKDHIAVGVMKEEFQEIMIQANGKNWNSRSELLPLPVNINDIDFIYLYAPSQRASEPNSKLSTFQDLRDMAEFLGQVEKNGRIIWKYRILKGVTK